MLLSSLISGRSARRGITRARGVSEGQPSKYLKVRPVAVFLTAVAVVILPLQFLFYLQVVHHNVGLPTNINDAPLRREFTEHSHLAPEKKLTGEGLAQKVDQPNRVDEPAATVTINMTNILWSRNWNKLATCSSVPQEYYTLANVRTWCRKPYTTECIHKPEQLKEWFLGCQPDIGKRHLVLWVRLQSAQGDLSLFIEHVLPLMKHPFELISTDGDSSVPSMVKGAEQLLNNPLLIKWHTQNYDGTISDPKLHPIPIGLDLHTVGAERPGLWSTTSKEENFRQMKIIRDEALGNKGNRSDVFWVPPMNVRNHEDRSRAHDAAKCLNHTYSPRLSVPELYRAYTEYRFGFSPRGNGLDAHRTWEMLFFGMIPIVRTGPLDPIYTGLPVLIVEEWEDICKPGHLDQFYARWADRLPVPDEFLTMQYFLRKDG